MNPDKRTRLGTTVVYDPPGHPLSSEKRSKFTFLGVIDGDDEYAWIATRDDGKPEVFTENLLDLLIVPDPCPRCFAGVVWSGQCPRCMGTGEAQL